MLETGSVHTCDAHVMQGENRSHGGCESFGVQRVGHMNGLKAQDQVILSSLYQIFKNT